MKFKFEPKDFTEWEILEGLDYETEGYSNSELEDYLKLSRDEIGKYYRSELLELIYDSYSNKKLFDIFNLWQYFAERYED